MSEGASTNEVFHNRHHQMKGITVASQIPPKGAPGPKTPAKKTTARKAPAKKAPGKAVAVVKKTDDKLPTDLTPAKARAVTKRIKDRSTDLVEALHEAWKGRAWLVFGHKDWDTYLDNEFDGVPLALPRMKRKAAVASLTERGWSTRAIAAATGTGQSTIIRDQREASSQVNQNGSVDSGNVIDIDPKDVTEIPEGESRTVTGLDGKERTVTPSAPQPSEPVVINVVSVAKTLAKDLANVTVRLGALYDRDDYTENQVDVDKVLQQAIDDFAEEVGDRLPQFDDAGHTIEREPEPAV